MTVGLEANRFRYRMLDHKGCTVSPVCFSRLKSRSKWNESAAPGSSRPSHHSIPTHLEPGPTKGRNLTLASSATLAAFAPQGNHKEALNRPPSSPLSLPTTSTPPPPPP